MQVEYYGTVKITKFVFGYDLDFRDWGIGVSLCFGSSGSWPIYFGIQLGPLGLFTAYDS